MERKKKEREAKLDEIKNEWVSFLTREYVEDKVSCAIMLGRSRAHLINVPEELRQTYETKELDFILKKLDTHLHEICQFKGMRLTFQDPSSHLYNYNNLYIVWDQPSCSCSLQ